MITANEAQRLLLYSTGSGKHYKRIEVEALTDFLNRLVEIELGTLPDDFFYSDKSHQSTSN
jgi:hypothetical protein